MGEADDLILNKIKFKRYKKAARKGCFLTLREANSIKREKWRDRMIIYTQHHKNLIPEERVNLDIAVGEFEIVIALEENQRKEYEASVDAFTKALFGDWKNNSPELEQSVIAYQNAITYNGCTIECIGDIAYAICDVEDCRCISDKPILVNDINGEQISQLTSRYNCDELQESCGSRRR